MRIGGMVLAGVLAGMAAAGPGAGQARSQAAPQRDLMHDTWVGVDGLGRAFPGAAECGPPRPGKFVAIFYFLWMQRNANAGLYDISKLLAANPTDPQYGPVPAFHWWGEPYLGYYTSDDPFVIRKHAQMLSDAGVDVVIFDVTNAFTYDSTYLAICKVFEEIRKSGRSTPQIAFITHASSAKIIQKLYDDFYSKNLYADLWFRWLGKPLILGSPEGLSPQVQQFFTIRDSWAWTKGQKWFGNGKDKWPWIDNYPQNPGWRDSPDKPEEISVCVAQHPVSNIGRSFHDGKEPPPDQQTPALGLCFAEQWKRALQVDPQLVFITGWNEWIAQRFLNEGGMNFLGHPLKKGDSFFVDEYDEEYSRDVEPMTGGHTDDYYYQMCDNIRRFKGVRPIPLASAPLTIRLNSGFQQWDHVAPTYLDDIGDTVHRSHPGWGPAGPYINTSGRNDFDTMKVARDSKYLYFYVRTAGPITQPEGSTWMLLLLNIDDNWHTGWNGYDFIVNHVRGPAGYTTLERNVGGQWKWLPMARIRYVLKGNQMMLAIPRPALGLSNGRAPLRMDFKWADNVPDTGDILSFIDQGDTAPNARFAYRYEDAR